MIEPNTCTGNAAIKIIQKGILLNTKDQYMKDSITHAGNVTLSILKGKSILS